MDLDRTPFDERSIKNLLQAYGNHCHNYALEQAAENVKVITREIKTDDPGSVFNSIPVYMGIDKQSILDLKINK